MSNATWAAEPSPQGESADEFSISLATYFTAHNGADAVVEATSVHLLVGVSGAYSFDAYWAFAGSLRAGVGDFSGTMSAVVHGLVEARYVIDRMTWRPWLAIGVGALYRSSLPQTGSRPKNLGHKVDATVHAAGGVDYQLSAQWSLGALLRYNVIVTEPWGRSVGPFDISAQARFHF